MITDIKKLAISISLLLITATATAQRTPEQIAQGRPANSTNPAFQAGRFAYDLSTKKLPAADKPTPLPQIPRSELTEGQKRIANLAEELMEGNSPNLAVVMVEKGQLLFEKYNSPAGPRAPLMSWSMSKSLTAMTIGEMHCDSKIGSLDSPARTYSNLLDKTIYGDASVKNLLTMSSGAEAPLQQHGERLPDVWKLLTFERRYTTKEYIQNYGQPHSRFKSGERFIYSNTDTLALGAIGESNGGFSENFNRYIWSKIGAEYPGYWLVDREGKVITYAGFNATARDWARLAMFSLKQLKSNDECIRNFMRASISPQMPNHSGMMGSDFGAYGYQIWISNAGPRPSYWFVGYAGQRIGVDPEKERILVVASWWHGNISEFQRLFYEWQRQ